MNLTRPSPSQQRPVTVSKDEARGRALKFLADSPSAQKNAIASAVWPDAQWWAPQGAAFAAAKLIFNLRQEGLIEDAGNSHYRLTGLGQRAAKEA